MKDDFPYAICCPSCGKLIGRSFAGTRSFTHCPHCSAEFTYRVDDKGSNIQLTKEPKKAPEVPAVPA